jgi:hypothetical protein
MRAYEEKSLDRNIALQQRSNDLSLQGLTSQATNAAADIRREKESWDEGGYRYAQQKVQDDYYDWQIHEAGFDWSDPLDWLDLTVSGLQGASTGLSLWNSWNYASSMAGGGNGSAAGGGGGTTPPPPATTPVSTKTTMPDLGKQMFTVPTASLLPSRGNNSYGIMGDSLQREAQSIFSNKPPFNPLNWSF